MSEPIKAGDMVMVVRGHFCVVEKYGGVPYTVRFIVEQRDGGWLCLQCHQCDIAPEEYFAANLEGLHRNEPSGLPLGWLKRIPPLGELEGEKRDEEIAA